MTDPKELVDAVMAAATSDGRVLSPWIPTLREIADSLAAGEPRISFGELVRRTGKSHNGIRRDIARFRYGGYLEVHFKKGEKATLYVLKLPSAEELSRDLSRADRWRADMFAGPIDPSIVAALERLLATMRGYVDDMRKDREAAPEPSVERNEDDGFDAERHRQLGIKLGFGAGPTEALVEMRRLRLNPPPARVKLG